MSRVPPFDCPNTTCPVDRLASTTTAFTWEYEDGSEDLLRLYAKGKKQQWDAAERLDWSQEIDPDNPMGMSDRTIAIHGTDLWNSLDEKDRVHMGKQ